MVNACDLQAKAYIIQLYSFLITALHYLPKIYLKVEMRNLQGLKLYRISHSNLLLGKTGELTDETKQHDL